MTLALEAAPTRLALETKAIADARRVRAAIKSIGPAINAVGRALAAAFQPFARAVIEAARQIANLVQQIVPEGHYWRDGKWRRDHSYFRRRAKLRRAALKATRQRRATA
jgi:hypothetical protein